MKGRNSSCINIRLDDKDIEELRKRGKIKGFNTAGTYVKFMILRSLHSDITTG